MQTVPSDPSLIAACGIYCGACKKHISGRCPGCKENIKATWCKVRSCVFDRGFASCAECHDFARPQDCKKLDNPIARVFGLLFNSDRAASLLKLRELGPTEYASFMAQRRRVALPRRGTIA